MRELTTDVAINIYRVVLNLSENTIDKDNVSMRIDVIQMKLTLNTIYISAQESPYLLINLYSSTKDDEVVIPQYIES